MVILVCQSCGVLNLTADNSSAGLEGSDIVHDTRYYSMVSGREAGRGAGTGTGD